MLETLTQLFDTHAPETLMAFFGVVTSLSLLYLVWLILRHFFGLEKHSAIQETHQEEVTTTLLEALVGALVAEAGHLRQTLDGLLQESLKRSEQNAAALATLLIQAEQTPREVLGLLKPEFDQLHQQVRQTEARLIDTLMDTTHTPEPTEEV